MPTKFIYIYINRPLMKKILLILLLCLAAFSPEPKLPELTDKEKQYKEMDSLTEIENPSYIINGGLPDPKDQARYM